MVRSEQGAGKDRLIGTSAQRRRVRSALAEVGRTSPLHKKLPLAGSKSNFRFIPETGLNSAIAACPKCAKGGSDPDSRRRGTAIVRHMRNGSVEPCFLILISE
jgi:hypothetical protein